MKKSKVITDDIFHGEVLGGFKSFQLNIFEYMDIRVTCSLVYSIHAHRVFNFNSNLSSKPLHNLQKSSIYQSQKH